MQNLKQLLLESKLNKWPYPKTFEALIKAGVSSYTVHFGEGFQSLFQGSFGTYEEPAPQEYYNIDIAKTFSAQGVKDSIIKHMTEKTSYIAFLRDIAGFGASHYVVDMSKRTITYYNPDETQFHIEVVPLWNEP